MFNIGDTVKYVFGHYKGVNFLVDYVHENNKRQVDLTIKNKSFHIRVDISAIKHCRTILIEKYKKPSYL